ncbi:uncharacterized protein LOC143255764 isoform X1 [Tachypleus tridentatus]|uniref:uncharacterized protein LOC143255764 isoform X1 n=1 Tax=Tachypleus tridentatus TaxID=6853 RepID=UPI003FD11A92
MAARDLRTLAAGTVPQAQQSHSELSTESTKRNRTADFSVVSPKTYRCTSWELVLLTCQLNARGRNRRSDPNAVRSFTGLPKSTVLEYSILKERRLQDQED